jgi:hypothetical protein
MINCNACSAVTVHSKQALLHITSNIGIALEPPAAQNTWAIYAMPAKDALQAQASRALLDGQGDDLPVM